MEMLNSLLKITYFCEMEKKISNLYLSESEHCFLCASRSFYLNVKSEHIYKINKQMPSTTMQIYKYKVTNEGFKE